MQNMYDGFMIYSLICFTLRLFSLATVLAYAIFCCKTGVKLSAAAWKSCATTQVRVAKPGWGRGGGGTVALGTRRPSEGMLMVALRTDEMCLGGCDSFLEDRGDTTLQQEVQ